MALGLACAGTTALAEKADRTQPMNVVADTLRYDDLKQVSEFSGHVILTKGTLTIRADKVQVRQDPQGYQYGTATAAPGQRAFFRQKREKLDEWIEGEAETLLYDGKADRVQFSTNAVIRRYQGATLLDESTGHSVVYENTSDQFTVDGHKPGGSRERVRTLLAPRTPAQALPPESANPLKPSPALTGNAS
ncbi:MAG: lipopolysaccharide transport periplasmic protein LptA [Pseudomonadota bacterium]